MLPTPDTSHVSFDNVYEPAEDSFLLLDTLSSPSETAWLRDRFQIPQRCSAHSQNSTSLIVLEVGVGSGVVLAFVAVNAQHLLGRRDVLAIGTDLNAFACRGAARTVSKAYATNTGVSAVFGGILNADMASSLKPGMADILICNPPYVPTEALPTLEHYETYMNSTETTTKSFDRDSRLLELSYAGGEDGMEMTDKLLAQLPSLLHPTRGVAYILLCAQNKPMKVRDRMRAITGLAAELISSSGRQAGWEKLQILRIWKISCD